MTKVSTILISLVMLASYANVEMRLLRILPLLAIAVPTILLLPRARFPQARPAFTLIGLALGVGFALSLARIFLFRYAPIQSMPIAPAALGMTACWFLGMNAAVTSRTPQRLLILFGCVVPLGCLVLLLAAFAAGTIPETNYWLFLSQGGLSEMQATHAWFAMSEDSVRLLAFQVAVVPFALIVPHRGIQIASLVGASAALFLLLVNGSVTYPVAAVTIAAAGLILTRTARMDGIRRPSLAPLIAALALGTVAGGTVIALRPQLGLPLIASIANKDVTAGNSVLDGRDVLWTLAVKHISDSPLIGYPLDERTNEETRFAYSNPHNDYLLAALKFGIPGALVLVAFMALVAWSFVRDLRRPIDDVTQGAALLGFAAWMALLVPPVFSGVLSSPFFSNLTLAGIAAMCFTTLRLRREGMHT